MKKSKVPSKGGDHDFTTAKREGLIEDERQELPGFERNAPTRQTKHSKVFKTPIQRAKEKK